MSRNAALMLVIGLLGGWIVAQGLPGANASGHLDDFRMGTADTEGRYSVATGRVQGRDADVLYVWNHELQRLAVYQVTNNALQVLHVRNCEFDFKADEFNLGGRRAQPSVKEMKENLKKP